MILRHVALTCSSEINSDRIFKDLFGLQKSEPKILPLSLCEAIFDVDSELVMINYRGEDIHFEIFVTGDSKSNVKADCTCLPRSRGPGNIFKKMPRSGCERVPNP